MKRRNIEKPEGFDEFAATHGLVAIAKHFGMSVAPAMRFVRAMPADWRAARDVVMRENQRAAGLRNMPIAIKARSEQCRANPRPRAKRKEDLSKRRELYAAKLAAQGRSAFVPRSRPDDLCDVLCRMTRHEAAAHYQSSAGSVYRWYQKLPDDQRAKVAAADAERKAAASAANAEKAAQAKRAKVAARRVAKLDKTKLPGKQSLMNWGFQKPTAAAPARGGVEGEAAQFLRRRNSVVCRGETISKALAGFWIVGARPAMTPDAMVALAKAGGWNPDAWRSLAA